MSEDQPITGVRKRQQIKNANRQVLVWVGVAAAAVTICVMVAINFIQRISYQVKVNGALSETSSTLRKNVETSIPELLSNVDALENNQSLRALQRDPQRYSVLQVVDDALPMAASPNDDVMSVLGVSLLASLQSKILAPSGVNIEQISGNIETKAAATATTTSTTTTAANTAATTVVSSEPKVLNFTVTVNGTYDSIQRMIADMERTIRPIDITSINLQGSNDKLQATVTATTYYVPKTDYQLGKKEIEVNEEQ